MFSFKGKKKKKERSKEANSNTKRVKMCGVGGFSSCTQRQEVSIPCSLSLTARLSPTPSPACLICQCLVWRAPPMTPLTCYVCHRNSLSTIIFFHIKESHLREIQLASLGTFFTGLFLSSDQVINQISALVPLNISSSSA